MSLPLPRGEAVLRFLPHRPPIILVDELTASDGDTHHTRLTVRDDNVFAEHGRLLEAGLIEHVAQSTALGTGYAAAGADAGSPPVGFIGAVSRLRIDRLPVVGALLETTIALQHRLPQVQVLHGTVRSGGTVIAEMEMKVFLMGPADAA
ncbi:MAG: hydroxymyristoyl-ACP dehydratase [Flavobacteriales bacterium]|nr:hydroxymyristoyl-ACP dehydratase [Flavobacteriales bacterium]